MYCGFPLLTRDDVDRATDEAYERLHYGLDYDPAVVPYRRR